MEDINVDIDQNPTDKTKVLYDAVSKDYNVGSFDEFSKKLQNPSKREAFYKGVGSEYSLGSYDEFSKKVGAVEKKNLGGTVSPTELPASSPSQLPKRLNVDVLAYADNGQKAAVPQPNTVTEKLFGNVRPEKQQLDVTPKVRNVEKEIEVEQVGKKITSDAINNTVKAYKDRLSGDGAYKISDTDPALINQKNELEKDLKEGNLQVVKSQKTGQYILARKNGALQSISQAYNNVKQKEADDKYVASLSTIDKIKHFDNKAALVKDEYLPSQPSGFGGAFGTLIGENATPLVKMGAMATAAGKVGQYLGLTGTALANAEKFGSFLAFANDAGYSGYANNTEKVYNALRKQNPNGDKIDQMQRAERAGLVGEVSGIATAGAMTGALAKLTNAAKNVNVQPLVKSLEQLAHHTVKESAIQGGFAAGGSIVSDLGAISQGVKMKPSEVIGGAFEAGKGMVEFVAVMGSAMGIVAGLANVPKYVKAQATGTLAKLDPVLVNDAYKEAEANGALDPGTAEKAMQQINQFKEAQNKVPNDLPDENVNAISGIQQKIDKLEAQKKTLAPQFHDRIDAVIDSLRNRSKEIASSNKPLEKEVDDITQQPTNVKIEPAIEAPIVEEIPTDLEERGEQIESTLEAERRRSNGERIFAISEQDEMPTEVTSIEMLRSYTPDQLIAYKPKEEVKPKEQIKSEELDKLKKIFNSNDVIPATSKTINIDEEIAKNNEIIKNGNSLDISFAKMSNKTLLEIKRKGKTEFQETDYPPKGYRKTTFKGKEYFTSEEKYKPKEEVEVKSNKDVLVNENALEKQIPKEEVKPKEQLKSKENAIQEPSTSSVLQYPQEGARETGGERGRVEPSKQGEAIAEKGKQAEGNEEEVKPKEYTSKTGRQKIVYDEKGNSKVIDTKTGKEVSRETAKKVFNEAADNFDFSKGKKASFEGADLKDEREVENYTIENSSNPTEIAEVYARQELEPPVLNSAETAIVNHGIGKVSVKSFKEVNDANNITFGLAKNWFQKGGKGADLGAKAEEISDKMGVPVSAEDIANFMIRFPSGARAEKLIENQTAYNAREKFEKLTGLPLTEEIAHKAIDYEFNKLTKEQQAIAEQDFKTRKQLEDAYWAEQPGAIKPAPEKGDNIAVKQAAKAEKGLKEPIVEKKPLEGIQKEYQEVINKTGERVREKAKLEFVERNFDSILNKLKEKIKEKCPT